MQQNKSLEGKTSHDTFWNYQKKGMSDKIIYLLRQKSCHYALFNTTNSWMTENFSYSCHEILYQPQQLPCNQICTSQQWEKFGYRNYCIRLRFYDKMMLEKYHLQLLLKKELRVSTCIPESSCELHTFRVDLYALIESIGCVFKSLRRKY